MRHVFALFAGDRVTAPWYTDSQRYDAVVLRSNQDGTYDVRFDEGLCGFAARLCSFTAEHPMCAIRYVVILGWEQAKSGCPCAGRR